MVDDRTLNARRLCTAMHYASKAGIREADTYKLKPGSDSGHYSRKLKTAMGDTANEDDVYPLSIPSYDKRYLRREKRTLKVFPAHEEFAKDMLDDTDMTRLEQPGPPHSLAGPERYVFY